MRRFSLSVAGVCLLLVWEFLSRSVPALRFSMSSPIEIWFAAGRLLSTGTFWKDFAATGACAFGALVIGTAAGSAVGIVAVLHTDAEHALRRALLAVSSIPVLAVAPLVILIIGIDWPAKVVIGAIPTFLLSAQLSLEGARSVQKQYEVLILQSAPPWWRLIWHLLLPGSFLWILQSLRANVGAALLGVFLAEYISSSCGLGHLIMKASSLYRVDEMWCGVLAFMVLAQVLCLLEGAFSVVKNKEKKAVSRNSGA
ncbi:ABC transporter permease subunit [bacterium]|nr:ABC transporter permease subunit [bacterium]